MNWQPSRERHNIKYSREGEDNKTQVRTIRSRSGSKKGENESKDHKNKKEGKNYKMKQEVTNKS